MIYPVTPQALPDCVDIIRESFLTVAHDLGFTPENAPRFTAFSISEDRLAAALANHHPMFLWEAEGRPAGFYALRFSDGEDCELNHLSVLPGQRHRGIGTALVSHAVETARAAGKLRLSIGIVEENLRLRSWYEGLGFRHTGTKKFGFFPFTCGYMELTL